MQQYFNLYEAKSNSWLYSDVGFQLKIVKYIQIEPVRVSRQDVWILSFRVRASHEGLVKTYGADF